MQKVRQINKMQRLYLNRPWMSFEECIRDINMKSGPEALIQFREELINEATELDFATSTHMDKILPGFAKTFQFQQRRRVSFLQYPRRDRSWDTSLLVRICDNCAPQESTLVALRKIKALWLIQPIHNQDRNRGHKLL